jgi:hypothetical protein
MMKVASNACNPNKKEHKMTITDADAAFNEAWDQLVNTCNGDVKEIGDRLRSQARFGMFNDLSKDPDEEQA